MLGITHWFGIFVSCAIQVKGGEWCGDKSK